MGSQSQLENYLEHSIEAKLVNSPRTGSRQSFIYQLSCIKHNGTDFKINKFPIVFDSEVIYTNQPIRSRNFFETLDKIHQGIALPILQLAAAAYFEKYVNILLHIPERHSAEWHAATEFVSRNTLASNIGLRLSAKHRSRSSSEEFKEGLASPAGKTELLDWYGVSSPPSSFEKPAYSSLTKPNLGRNRRLSIAMAANTNAAFLGQNLLTINANDWQVMSAAAPNQQDFDLHTTLARAMTLSCRDGVVTAAHDDIYAASQFAGIHVVEMWNAAKASWRTANPQGSAADCCVAIGRVSALVFCRGANRQKIFENWTDPNHASRIQLQNDVRDFNILETATNKRTSLTLSRVGLVSPLPQLRLAHTVPSPGITQIHKLTKALHCNVSAAVVPAGSQGLLAGATLYQICFDAKIGQATRRRHDIMVDRVMAFAEMAQNNSVILTDAQKTMISTHMTAAAPQQAVAVSGTVLATTPQHLQLYSAILANVQYLPTHRAATQIVAEFENSPLGDVWTR